jgi:hypothetical protein
MRCAKEFTAKEKPLLKQQRKVAKNRKRDPKSPMLPMNLFLKISP